VTQVREAARAIGQQIHVVTASTEGDFDTALTAAVQKRAGALFVTGDPLFTTRRAQLVALAAKHAIPASYSFRDLAAAGGFMSYGANLPDVHRRRACIRAGSSRAPSQPSCRSCSRPSSTS
jgi:putative tryptophan/tyrosine transport system substrate-binding protein